MSVRIGIYDFFANTIPGILYLFSITYLFSILGFVDFDSQFLYNVSILHVVLLAILGYVVGLVFDSIAVALLRPFRPKDLSKIVLDKFKVSHPELDIKFGPNDWPIILAYLRRENEETASSVEKFNATNIMLRNISLSLAILSVTQIIHAIQTNFDALSLILFFAFVLLTIISVKKSIRYATWFYTSQYEAITAESMKATDFVEKLKKKKSPTRG